MSYLYYRGNKRLILQKELNHKQKIETRQQEEKLKIIRVILRGEEKESERIAKELRDVLGGMLAGVKINLSGWASAHSTGWNTLVAWWKLILN